MTKNLIIWLIGGNSVGKTTQARRIHSYLGGLTNESFDPQIVKWIENEKKCCYTLMSPLSANLGELAKTACGGTDTLNSKFQIQRSLEEVRKVREVVIIEGIMATGQWIDFLATSNTVLLTILLDVSEDNNFRRLRQRRGAKMGIDPSEVQISVKTQENLSSKLRGFRSLFSRASQRSNYSMSLDTNVLTIEEVTHLILPNVKNIILNEF